MICCLFHANGQHSFTKKDKGHILKNKLLIHIKRTQFALVPERKGNYYKDSHSIGLSFF